MAFCSNCGAELFGNFCTRCGAVASSDENSAASSFGSSANPYAAGSQSAHNGAYRGGSGPAIPSFLEAWPTCMKKSFTMEGRASRKEYWGFTLVNFVIFVGLRILIGMLVVAGDAQPGGEPTVVQGLLGLVYLGCVLSVLPATICGIVRRLHDSDRAGGWFFVLFVPLIGGLLLTILTVLEPTKGANRFGKQPTYRR